jgi:hypothetical protein
MTGDDIGAYRRSEGFAIGISRTLNHARASGFEFGLPYVIPANYRRTAAPNVLLLCEGGQRRFVMRLPAFGPIVYAPILGLGQ